MGVGGLRGGVGLGTPDSTSNLLSTQLPHQMQLVCTAWPRPSPAPCSRGGKPLLGLSVLLGLTRGQAGTLLQTSSCHTFRAQSLCRPDAHLCREKI